MGPDSPRIVKLSKNLLKYGTYGKPEEDGLVHVAIARIRKANGTLSPADANGLRPESFRPPGYSAFLAAVAGSFGDLRWGLLLQCVFGAGMAWMTVAITWTLGLTRRGCLIAGCLWAIHPSLIVHDTLFLTEHLAPVAELAG